MLIRKNYRCDTCGTALIHTDETCPRCNHKIVQSDRPSPPSCSLCGIQIVKNPGNFIRDLIKAETSIIVLVDSNRSASSENLVKELDQFDATLCLSCYRIACFGCHDPTKQGLKCLSCGGDLNILTASNYRLWLAKQTHAVRVLIAYDRDTCPEAKEIKAILDNVWDGRLGGDTKITAYPIADHNWSSDKNLAIAWKALQSVLEYRDGEHAYWKDCRVKSLSGRVAETGQRFYVEVYYE